MRINAFTRLDTWILKLADLISGDQPIDSEAVSPITFPIVITDPWKIEQLLEICDCNFTYGEYLAEQKLDYIYDAGDLYVNCNGCSKPVEFKFKAEKGTSVSAALNGHHQADIRMTNEQSDTFFDINIQQI